MPVKPLDMPPQHALGHPEEATAQERKRRGKMGNDLLADRASVPASSPRPERFGGPLLHLSVPRGRYAVEGLPPLCALRAPLGSLPEAALCLGPPTLWKGRGDCMWL